MVRCSLSRWSGPGRIGRREAKRSGAIALVATGIAAALFGRSPLRRSTIGCPSPPRSSSEPPSPGWLLVRTPLEQPGPGPVGVGATTDVRRRSSPTGVDATLIAFPFRSRGRYAARFLHPGRDWFCTVRRQHRCDDAPAPHRRDSPNHDFRLVPLNGACPQRGAGSRISSPATSDEQGQGELIALASTGSAVALLGAGWTLPASLASVTPAVGALFSSSPAFATVHHRGFRWPLARSGSRPPPFCSHWPSSSRSTLTFLVPAGLATALVVTVAALFAGDLRRVLIIGTVGTAAGLLALVHDRGPEQLLAHTGSPTNVRLGIAVGVVLACRDDPAHGAWDRVPGHRRPSADRRRTSSTWRSHRPVRRSRVCGPADRSTGSAPDTPPRHSSGSAPLPPHRCGPTSLPVRRTQSHLPPASPLITAAVAKLFLFDLPRRAGLPSVIAFLVAGSCCWSRVAYAQSLRQTTWSHRRQDQPQPIAPMTVDPLPRRAGSVNVQV